MNPGLHRRNVSTHGRAACPSANPRLAGRNVGSADDHLPDDNASIAGVPVMSHVLDHVRIRAEESPLITSGSAHSMWTTKLPPLIGHDFEFREMLGKILITRKVRANEKASFSVQSGQCFLGTSFPTLHPTAPTQSLRFGRR